MDDAYARLKAEEAWWQAMPAYERQEFDADRRKSVAVNEVTSKIRQATKGKAPV